MTKQFTYASLFAGIGGFESGLNKVGGRNVFASEIDKFARQSYKALYGVEPSGDITKIDSKDIPNHDLLTAGFPCFAAGTLISTSSGYKKVEDIAEGDMVLTHKNRYRKVLTPMAKEKRGIYELKVMGSPKTLVTEEHPFYVIEKNRVWNNYIRRYETYYSEPMWVNAEDLDKEKHLIGFSVDPTQGNPLEITLEEAFLLGRYVADGHIHDGKTFGKKNSYNNKVVFSVGTEKLEEFLSEVQSYHVGYSEDKNVCKCYIINKRIMNLCKLFGRGAENKIIHGGILSSNSDIRNAFLKGYWSGDGSFDGTVYKATTVSKELAYGIGRLVQNTYNIPYSIQFTKRPKTTVIKGRVVNQKDTWTVSYRKEATVRQSVMLYDIVWNPIRKIEWNNSFQGHVFNMEVDGDNSYVANNMSVHNCQSFSVAGNRSGMAYKCTSDSCGTTQTISFQQYANRDFVCESCGGRIEAVDGRGLLFFEVARIARDKKPKVVLLENVKGLVGHDKGRTLDIIVRTMSEIGYVVDFDILNSKYFGVPQNRERIFIVAVREDIQPHEEWQEDSLKGNTVVPKGKRRIAEYEDVKTFNFDFPKLEKVTKRLRDILEDNVDERYYLDAEKTSALVVELESKTLGTGLPIREATTKGYAVAAEGDAVNFQFPNSKTRRGRVGKEIANTLEASNINQGVVVVPKDARAVLTPDRLVKRQKGRKFKEVGEEIFTLTSQDRHGVMEEVAEGIPMDCKISVIENLSDTGHGSMDGLSTEGVYTTITALDYKGPKLIALDSSPARKYLIRKLTPKECWRLQGFTDTQHDASENAGLSNSQRYKQAGNAVTVNVIHAIGTNLKKYL